jgi:hypothetical protein
MPKIIRPDGRQLVHSTWALSALIGIVAVCLLGLIAISPRAALWVSNAAQAEFAGAVSEESEPILLTKKPVRYEAVINNWKHYRSSAKPNEIAGSTPTDLSAAAKSPFR